jgi:hypothetical protein
MFRPTTVIRELVLSLAQYKLPDDGRRPKHVGVIFV